METLIKKIVSDHFNVSIELLESRTRVREIAIARQFSMALTKKFTFLSLSSIGKLYNRDHTTVIHALQCVSDMRDTQRVHVINWDALVHKIELVETPFERLRRIESTTIIRNDARGKLLNKRTVPGKIFITRPI